MQQQQWKASFVDPNLELNFTGGQGGMCDASFPRFEIRLKTREPPGAAFLRTTPAKYELMTRVGEKKK